MEVEGYLEFSRSPGLRIAQDKNGKAVHRETPDHAEGVQVREECDLTVADEDGDELQDDNDVDDPIAGAELRMRLAEPGTKYTVFGYAVQYSVGADDRRVYRSGQDQRANDNHKCMEDQPGQKRAMEAHRQSTDEVFQVILANRIGNDHHREKRNERGKHQAIDENNHPSFLEVRQLGMLNFAIHLGQGLFSAHGQHGMPERNEDGHNSKHVREIAVNQPAKRAGAELQIAAEMGRAAGRNGARAPCRYTRQSKLLPSR